MLEAFWVPIAPAFFLGLVLSWLAENLLTPRPVAPWRRPAAAVLVHVGVWAVAFALELALFRRPYFAMANVLAIELVIVLVSIAKYQALREPFIYQDFEYFTDAIRHPRLYLPFFGAWRAVAAGGGYGVALWAGLSLEDSLTEGAGVWLLSFADLPAESDVDPSAPVGLFLLHVLALVLIGGLLAWRAGRGLHVQFQAGADLRRLGLVAALLAYARGERQSVSALQHAAPFGQTQAGRADEPLPNLVAIQSESFFDVRRAYPQIRPDVLRHFDQLRAESVMHGELRVGAWGANTVRTEFSFLAGMSADELGVHAYNPYRKLARQGFPTMASYLRSLGYRTICLHPYHRSFYRRDKVLPKLGFDEFIGLEAFADAPRDGAYVSDAAVGDYLIRLLQQESDRPVYVHVITMENHGPLHWESVPASEHAGLLRQPLPSGCDDLVAYARHLRNADAMFGAVRRALLEPAERPAALCLFGDHVPIMESVYERMGAVSGTTDYVIWDSRTGGQSLHGGEPRTLDVAALATTYLATIGLQPVGTKRTQGSYNRAAFRPGIDGRRCDITSI